MTETILISSDFVDKAFPESLHEVFVAATDGVLESRRDGARIRLLIEGGHIVDVASSDQEDWLGYHLRRTGRMSAKDFLATMRARDRSRKRYGTLLVERGILSPQEVYHAVIEQLEAIVWKMFEWTSGAAVFHPAICIGEGSRVRLQLPVQQAIVRGVRRMSSPRSAARLGEKETVLAPCFEDKDLTLCGLDADEYRVLLGVNDQRTIAELVTSEALDAAENLKLLYAFQILGLIRVSSNQRRRGPIQVRIRTSGDDLTR